MIETEFKPNEIVLSSSFNKFTYLYNKSTLSSEEAWLGVDFFSNDPYRSWWNLEGSHRQIYQHWSPAVLLALEIKTGPVTEN